MVLRLPRFVIAKPLASGTFGFYFTIPTYYRKQGCAIPNEPLGNDYHAACGDDGKGGHAGALNARFDEWKIMRQGIPFEPAMRFGTVDWLFRTYKSSKAYLAKVSERSRKDYERTMLLVSNIITKKGDRVGDRGIKAITPGGADKLYEKIIQGKKGERLRQGEKAVKLCSKAWRVVYRLHPKEFNKDVVDPWAGVALKCRVKKVKPAATREQVYEFAWGCISRGRPEPAAAAVICFEWLQRPENVLAGKIRWSDYRGREHPTQIKIEHHKTGALVWHPLEELTEAGPVRFYEDAEEVLAQLPRRGIPMNPARSPRIEGPAGRPNLLQIVFVQWVRKDHPEDAQGDRVAVDVHSRRLPSWRHDRARGSRADRRPRTRSLGALQQGLRRIRQAHTKARAGRNSQTSRLRSSGQGANRVSE